MRLDLRVMPRASRTSIDGMRDGRLIVRVTAAPVENAANEAVIAALAKALDLPRRAFTIVAGANSRNKTVEISGADDAAVRSRLS